MEESDDFKKVESGNNSLKKIRAAIADPATFVVSFDVFDTLLLRPFWKPTDLFFFLDRKAEELVGTDDVVNFSIWRQEAEAETRLQANRDGLQDVTLDMIYGTIADTCPLPGEVVELLKQEELRIEKRFCYVRESAKELVEYAASLGKCVIAVSDMYLPAVFIRELLEVNGVKLETVFVSCEMQKTKKSGDLFDAVSVALGISGNNIVHIGDNLNTDVKMARKHGWRAFPFFRTVDLLNGKIPGYGTLALKHAYMDLRAALPNFYSMDIMGVRCMLAVVANRVYDNPFAYPEQRGDYADNVPLFGSMVLGMYSLALGFWLANSTMETAYDSFLFFSRDGFLPCCAFSLLKECGNIPGELHYVRISRTALMPLLLANDNRALSAGNHLRYAKQSPQTVTKLMSPVLKKEAIEKLTELESENWIKAFASERDMISFFQLLRQEYVDKEKLKEYESGFKKYFAPMMKGRVLCYDVGYVLRNETVLKEYFPEVKISAFFTNVSRDLPLIRSALTKTPIHSFFATSPFVSWLAREMLLTENAPSCIGYSPCGEPVLGEQPPFQPLLLAIQDEAIKYMEEFVSIFREECLYLPLQYADACLPMETFLHSPNHYDLKWIKTIEIDNSIDAGITDYKLTVFWRKWRTNYWMANHHLGKIGRHTVRFLMLLKTDREELKTLIRKRLSKK